MWASLNSYTDEQLSPSMEVAGGDDRRDGGGVRSGISECDAHRLAGWVMPRVAPGCNIPARPGAHSGCKASDDRGRGAAGARCPGLGAAVMRARSYLEKEERAIKEGNGSGALRRPVQGSLVLI